VRCARLHWTQRFTAAISALFPRWLYSLFPCWLYNLLNNSRFVSGHRSSDAISSSKSEVPLGAGHRKPSSSANPCRSSPPASKKRRVLLCCLCCLCCLATLGDNPAQCHRPCLPPPPDGDPPPCDAPPPCEDPPLGAEWPPPPPP